jgi:adenylate cyclase
MTETRKLAAILAADVVGYSRLMGEDEAGTARAVREHRETARPIVAGSGGRIVKTTGDGLLLEFASVVAATECAIAIQKLMVERNADMPEAKRIVYRIGVNLGDVLIEGDDILGDGVNIAARLESICEPGGVLISGAAYDHVRGRIDADFVDLGEKTLKNIARPVRVYAVNVGSSGQARALSPPSESSNGVAPRASIAVLPFANMSGDSEQEYFADGIAEDIITALCKLSQLFVIARNSSFTFKGRNVDIRDVSKNLGVRYVLEGSVRKSGNRVRISSQLIDAKTGGHLWAERFDRDLTDIFAVQDDVTQKIVAALALNLSAGDRQRLLTEHTDNLEAYDLLLRGRELYYLQSKESNSKARELSRRATELDPRFVPVVAFLSATHILDYMNGWSDSPSQSLEEARGAARLALALDDRYAPAHLAFGAFNLMARQHDEAIRAIETAISLNPNYAEAHNELGLILHYAGRSEEALPHFDRAMALNPYFPGHWLHFPAQAAYQLGRYEAAVAILKRRITRNPDTDASRVLLAASYGQLGLIKEAREAWREALRVNPAYSLEQRRNVLPYKNPEDFERVVEGLRKAGLPEP